MDIEENDLNISFDFLKENSLYQCLVLNNKNLCRQFQSLSHKGNKKYASFVRIPHQMLLDPPLHKNINMII